MARWLIPFAILLVIFQSIDWHKFVVVLSEANSWLVLAGILYYPLVISLGAVRWHIMLRAYHGHCVRYAASLKDYWSGMAIGVFAPASLGWDVYRVAVASKRYGKVIANSATIIVEKILALLTCACLVTLLVPFMDIAADNEDLQQIIKTTHIVLVATLGVLCAVFFMARHDAGKRFVRSITDRLMRVFDRLSQRSNLLESQKVSLTALFAPLLRPGILMRVTVFSFLIQLTSAVGNQIFFIAANYDLPFLVNLFAIPVLYFVFLLPISLSCKSC